MKLNIHPEYTETTVQCACGASYKTRSTKSNLRIGICSACHPFFTKEERLVDTGGRVGRFMRRYGSANAGAAAQTTTAASTGKKKK